MYLDLGVVILGPSPMLLHVVVLLAPGGEAGSPGLQSITELLPVEIRAQTSPCSAVAGLVQGRSVATRTSHSSSLSSASRFMAVSSTCTSISMQV